MPKINVYLPDDLAAAVKDSSIAVSSVCQQALADAVRTAQGAPIEGAAMPATADNTTLSRFTARARGAVTAATTAAGARDAQATTLDLLAGIVAEGENLALTLLAALDVEPPDLLAEAHGLSSTHTPTALAGAMERAGAEAIRLQHNFVGCEHLLLGLAAGPDDDPVVAALRSTGLDLPRLRSGVAAAMAGVTFWRGQTAAASLSAPVRTILEEIRDRLTRLERGTAS